MNRCPFCDNVVREKESFMESKNAFVIYNIKPVLPGHSLVIPKRHVITWENLTSEEITEIGLLSKALYKVLRKAFGSEGYNLVVQDGKGTGQTVPHVHMHVIPRKNKDMSNFKLYATIFYGLFKRRILKPIELIEHVSKLRNISSQLFPEYTPSSRKNTIK